MTASDTGAEVVEELARLVAPSSWARLDRGTHTLTSEYRRNCSLEDVRAVLTAIEASGRSIGEGWQPIEAAPKDGTTIWAVLRADIYPRLNPQRDDLEHWNGLQLPLRHPGIAAAGVDIGWNIAAPVGHGGIPDAWIAGWRMPPAAPAAGGERL